MSRTQTEPSSADRIAADGVRIQLKGEPHTLRFGLRALRYIEGEFESLDEFIERLRQKGAGKDFVRAICAGMIAGLLHEKPTEMALEVFEEHCSELLDEGGSLSEWMQYISRALAEGFPAPRQGRAGPKGKGSTKGSRGRAGTTSRRSSTDDRTRRSGR